MTRKITQFLLLVILAGITAFLVFLNLDHLTNPPWVKTFPLEGISRIITDQEGNTYCIAQARQRIYKIDAKGVSQYEIKHSENADSAVGIFADLTLDEKGNLYVLDTSLDDKGIYVEKERILRFDSRGQQTGELYALSYIEADRPLRAGRIKSIHVDSDTLRFVAAETHQIRLCSKPLNAKEVTEQVIPLPEDAYLYEACISTEDRVLATTLRGQILEIAANGSITPLYPSPKGKPYWKPAPLRLKKAQDGTFSMSDAMPAGADGYKTFPTRLKVSEDGELYFIDAIANSINSFSISNPTRINSLMTASDPFVGGGALNLKVIKDFAVSADGLGLTAAESMRLLQVDAPGSPAREITGISYDGGDRAEHWITWLQLLLTLILIGAALRIVYVDFMHRQVSLILKQIVIFAPLIAGSLAFVSYTVYGNLVAQEDEQVYRKLTLLTQMAQSRVDTALLQKIDSPADFMGPEYVKLLNTTIEAQLTEIAQKESSSTIAGLRTDREGLYSGIYKFETKDLLYSIVDYDNSVFMFRPIDIDPNSEFAAVRDYHKIVTRSVSDENGSWMFAMGPLYAPDGSLIGIYETGVEYAGFEQARKQLTYKLAKIIAEITLGVVIVFLLMTFFLLKSLRVLRDSVNEIAAGNWETTVDIHSGDEVSDLGGRFNLMAGHIRQYLDEITRLSESYYRFVPQRFLEMLGKKSILEVELGDQTSAEMTVLVCNIRSFVALSSRMDPEAGFNYFNAFLRRIGIAVRRNNGFIDEYLATGIRALFTGTPADAVRAAQDMRSELAAFNAEMAEQGFTGIDMGIGIHWGALRLGIIGEEERLQGTVISNDVNMTVMLETLTAKLGASILVTGETLSRIDGPAYPNIRSLGTLQLPGRDTPIELFDVFDADPADLRKAKQITLDVFERGVSLYRAGAFSDARTCFVEVVRRNPFDQAAKRYFFLCDEYFRSGTPQGWDASLEIRDDTGSE